jgi:anti-sigma-K factor RskA
MTMKPAHRPTSELIDRLAADYVVGSMKGGARRRFEAAVQADPVVARAVMRWQERLLPLDAGVQPLPAGEALWSRIENRAFGAHKAAAAPAPLRWWQRLLAPVPAGALAFGLLLGSIGPGLYQQLAGGGLDTQLPESYVGVLATADGRTGLIVSSLRRGRVVDFKQVTPVPVPAGQTLFLWTLDAKGQAQAVGPMPQGGFVSVPLSQSAEQLFQRAVELAVSLEPLGSTPAQPGSAYVYRGLCGKLWPVAPKPAAAGASS